MQPIVNKDLIPSDRLSDLRVSVFYSFSLRKVTVPVCCPKINKKVFSSLRFSSKVYRLKSLSDRDVVDIKKLNLELDGWKKKCSKFTVNLIEMTSCYINEALRVRSEAGEFNFDHCVIAISIHDRHAKHKLHGKNTGVCHCDIKKETLHVARLFSNPEYYNESKNEISVRGSGRALIQSAINYSENDGSLKEMIAFPENEISAHIFDSLGFSVSE